MAKRVNRGFVVFLAGISMAVAASACVLFAYQTKFKGHNAKRYAQDGDAAMSKDEPEKASALYGAALQFDPDNTDLLVKLGDALERLTPKDPQNLGKAMSAWNKAVSVDPHCVPALEKLLGVYSDQQDVNPRPELFVPLKGVCDKILAVHPDDRKAAEKKQIAVINQWLLNQSPSSDEVRDSIESRLPELIKKDPDNGDLVKALALARAQQAREMVDAQDAARAHLTVRETLEMVDVARKGKEQNESIQYRAFQSYDALRRVDPDAKDREKEYNERMESSIEAARALASKADPAADPICDEVMQNAAAWYTLRGKPEKGEEITRTFYDAHKDDQRARLAMARMLERKGDAKSRGEAMALLGREAPSADNLTGFKALVQREIQSQTVAELIRVRLAEYAAAPDAAARKRLAEQMDEGLDSYRRLTAIDAEPALDLEGQIHMAKGEDVEAVKSFQKAAGPVNPTFSDYDLLYRLARAYRATGQPGLAKQRLDQILAKVDDAVPPRIMLLEMAIEANDIPAAAAQYNRLQKLAPDSEQVKRLGGAVAMMNHAQDPKIANEVWVGMPETNRGERITKARVAVGLGKADEAVRLYQAVLMDAPGDPEASLSLASLYANNLGQKETAKRIMAEAVAKHPDDPNLVVTESRLNDDLPEVIYGKAVKAVEKNPDVFVRETQLFELESGPGGHPERAFGHLLAASKAKPDDVPVMDRLFGYYLGHGEFDKAQALVEKLAALDADKCGGLMYRYRFAFARRDLPAAEEIGRQLTRDYADFAASWLVSAQAFQTDNKFEEARDAYLDTLKRQPKQYEAYQGLIECYYKLNEPDQAKLKLEDACRLFPDDVRVREQLWNHFVNYGEADLAVPEREKALELNTRRQRDTADDYLSLAKAYFHAAQKVVSAKPQDAAGMLNKAFETLARGKEKFAKEPRFYSQLAEMYQYNRNLAEGEKVLLEFYNRDDFRDDPEPPLLLYDFYFRAEKLELCERYLNEAIVRADNKNDPRAVDYRMRLAGLLMQEKKFSDAYTALAAVPPNVRNSAPVVRQRIEILIAEGKRAEARKAVEKELAAHDTADLGNLLSSLMIDERQLDQAVAQLNHVLTLDPRNDAAIYLQALAVAQQGNIPQGINQLIGLRNRDPQNARVRMLLAELYEKSGQIQPAIRELSEGLEKQPLNKDMRLALIRQYRAQQPMTNDAWAAVLNLCRRAELDPVLGSDPTWPREESLALSDMDPPQKVEAVYAFQRAIKIAPPDNFEYRREFVDLMLKFQNDLGVMIETDKLIKEGRNDWWLHYQRGIALGRQGKKADAIVEYDKALDVTNKMNDPAQEEFIIRGMGATAGWDEALKRVTPLLASDADGRWRLLQASLLRAKNDFDGADQVVTAMLADPANKPGERRIPLLRAKAEIWESRPAVEKLDKARSVAAFIKARDAYAELLTFLPENMVCLNNLAYLLSEQIPAPEGGPLKAKVYSTKAYELTRFQQVANVMVLDTHAWVLTLCGGQDALEGQHILEDLITKRQDTKTFVEGRYHLGVAYLRAAKRNPKDAQKYLQEAMDLIAQQEKAGRAVDPALKDKVQSSLAEANGAVTATN